jgi:hypothetical protein
MVSLDGAGTNSKHWGIPGWHWKLVQVVMPLTSNGFIISSTFGQVSPPVPLEANSTAETDDLAFHEQWRADDAANATVVICRFGLSTQQVRVRGCRRNRAGPSCGCRCRSVAPDPAAEERGCYPCPVVEHSKTGKNKNDKNSENNNNCCYRYYRPAALQPLPSCSWRLAYRRRWWRTLKWMQE